MSKAPATLRIGLAQIDSRLGDLDGNFERHERFIHDARRQGVELLLFPELSLTGYRLLHLTPRMAINPYRSPQIARLARAAAEMSVVVGLVEEDEQGVLYNCALLLHRGTIALAHRKIYLPTYGIFQEGRFFGEGKRLALAPLDGADGTPSGARLGLLICEDLWHSELARRLARGGAKL